jgi:hypothetical protein
MGRSNLKFKGPTVKKLFSNRKLGLQIHQRGKDTLTVIAAMFIPLVRCTTWTIYMELIMQFQAVRVYFYNCSDSFYLQQTATVSRNLSTAPWTISTASDIQVVPRLLNQRKPPKEAKWQATKNWCSPKRLADVTAGSEVDFISEDTDNITMFNPSKAVSLASLVITQKRPSIATDGRWVVEHKDFCVVLVVDHAIFSVICHVVRNIWRSHMFIKKSRLKCDDFGYGTQN